MTTEPRRPQADLCQRATAAPKVAIKTVREREAAWGNTMQRTDVEKRALGIVERGTEGDFRDDLWDIEVALGLLVEATSPWLPTWNDEVSPAFVEKSGIEIVDFTLTGEQVNSLSDTWRLAYVARLVDQLCLLYGLTPSDDGQIRTLLHELDDLADENVVPNEEAPRTGRTSAGPLALRARISEDVSRMGREGPRRAGPAAPCRAVAGELDAVLDALLALAEDLVAAFGERARSGARPLPECTDAEK